MAFEEMLHGQPPRTVQEPVTARVVRVDSAGCWVVPLGDDQRHPVGPCRGPSDIPVGAIVMIIWTQERPWVFGAELVTLLTASARDVTLLEQAAIDAQGRVNTHAADHDNPHAVTKAQVGLGNVDNTSDADKPISADTQTALDTLAADNRDTGRRLVVAASDVTDLPTVEAVVRRRGDVVTVFTRETTAAAHAGATALYTLPAGFRPEAAAAASPVVDAAQAPVAGAMLTVTSAGALQLTAVSGSRHYAALTYLTGDAYPTSLPGTEA